MSMHDTIDIRWHYGPLAPEPMPRHEQAGAILAFEGVIRPTEDSKPITAIDYEAYQPMADMQMHELAMATLERFGILAVHVRHSTGRVPVGGVSFRLFIAAAHRAPAIESMAWFIDRMKQDVPIWKRPILTEPADAP